MSTIVTESVDRVMKVTFNRPGEGNRWNADVSEEMTELVAGLQNDEHHHVVLVQGTGDNFCLGSFNPKIRASMTKRDIVEFVINLNLILDRFEMLPQITIAALNGPAHGSGVEFSMACDIRYVSTTAHIGFPEADMGGFPGAGGPVRLPSLVGAARAMELICTGREVVPEEMKAIGFAQEVIEADVFDASVTEIATKISLKGPLALRGTKRLVRARTAPGFAESRMLSDELRRSLEWSEDVDEALSAYKEGRRPAFKGR